MADKLFHKWEEVAVTTTLTSGDDINVVDTDIAIVPCQNGIEVINNTAAAQRVECFLPTGAKLYSGKVAAGATLRLPVSAGSPVIVKCGNVAKLIGFRR